MLRFLGCLAAAGAAVYAAESFVHLSPSWFLVVSDEQRADAVLVTAALAAAAWLVSWVASLPGDQ